MNFLRKKILSPFAPLSFFLWGASSLFGEWSSDIHTKAIFSRHLPLFSPASLNAPDVQSAHTSLNETFFQPDCQFYEKESSLHHSAFSLSFMEEYLDQAYALRKDIFPPLLELGEVDGIIYGKKPFNVRVRLEALRTSLSLGWQFRKVHLITESEKDQESYQSIIEELFPSLEERPHFQFTLIHQLMYGLERGCEILNRHGDIAPYHLIFETCELFSTKQEARCRKAFKGASTCLGSCIFPIKDWRKEAKLHGYEERFDRDEITSRWFYAYMQLLSRKIHYEFVHGLDLDDEEAITAASIRQGPMKSSPQLQLFEKLAHTYYERALCSSQQDFLFAVDLLRSVGLMQYLKNLSQDFQLAPLLHKSSLAMNQMCTTRGAWTQLLSRSSQHKRLLQELREVTREKIQDPSLELKEILQDIQRGRDQILVSMVEHTFSIIGPPPCLFSLVTYGSHGREEATPYSDVEFGLLYEEAKPEFTSYFQALSTALLIQILNVRETSLFQLNLPSLSHSPPSPSKSCSQWFLDESTPRGFSIDLLDYPHSSKLPISSDKTTSLLGTPQEMAQKMSALSKENYFGYPHISERSIYENSSLFDHYKKCRADLLSLEGKSPFLHALEETLRHFSSFHYRSWDGQIDFKNTFLRLINRGIEILSTFYPLKSTNSFLRIQELQQLGVLSTEESHVLSVYLNQALRRRLSLQMERGGQYEGISPSLDEEDRTLAENKEKVLSIFRDLLQREMSPRKSPATDAECNRET